MRWLSVRGLSADEQREAAAWLAQEAGLLSSPQHPSLPRLVAAFSQGDDHYVASGARARKQLSLSSAAKVDGMLHQ
jgi:hypothetical protein